MNFRFIINLRHNLLFSFILLALLAAFVILPLQYSSEAGTLAEKGLVNRTESVDPDLENYDIRTDKSDKAVDDLLTFRRESGKTASAIADVRDDFVSGEEDLRRSVPMLKIEYNDGIRIPEVIAPDVSKGRAFLSGSSPLKRSEILRNFIKQNDSLIGVTDNQTDQLKVTADYTNPAGNLSFAHLEQRINDIPVFQGEIKAGFTPDGEIVRVINNLAPGLEYALLSTKFGDPSDAVKAAAAHINHTTADLTRNAAASDELKVVFGEGDWATTAVKTYFPTEVGVARPAWRVLIWEPVNAFYVIVDSETGTMLWRKNITEDQTQPATYNVYTNPSGYINVAESPFPGTPGPIDPNLGTQGVGVPRVNRTLVGNEGPLSFNANGWISNGGNRTDGNTVQAGLDIDGTNGIDPNGEAFEVTMGGRDFIFAYNPYDPNTNTGDSPTGTAFRNGAVTQLFYINNVYHDALYQLGFTEPALNFQHDNFGLGGLGNDRVSAEAQDYSGTNNANFSTPADGGRGRMQMYRWTLTTPNIDGDLDADVIIHEFTHGLSNRLHGNSFGLSSNMSRMMGEGWGDFFAHALLSQESDGITGVYSMGGYDTRNLISGSLGTANYYYGIRRFPKAVMAFTGGPSNRPHNPITFADVDQTTVSYADGAFAAPFAGHLSSTADQVHSGGEVWSAALWEVRAKMITRLGFLVGNQRVLQVVTDGMKLAPIGPTYLQERDAILAAASVFTGADVADVWEGFRIRGMGFGSRVITAGSGSGTARVTEAFDSPNVIVAETGFAVSDSPFGDGDGFPEPGEPVQLTIPIVNNTGQTINNVSVNVNGVSAASYGNIANGQTVTRQLPFNIPLATTCGSSINLNIMIGGSAGARTESRVVIIGVPNAPTTQNFDGVTAPALPAGWTTAQTGPGVAFVTQTGMADSAPNAVFTPNLGIAGGNSGASIDSPAFPINALAGVVSFRNKYDTEPGWDGGVLEISVNGGAFQDIITAGGRFIEGGYNGALGANSNPLDGRPAWTGNSGGYITSRAQLPAAANGQPVRFRWRFGEDTNTLNVGWNIDNVAVTSGYACSFTPQGNSARFDYDGDGKTDVSIFRPGAGQWWYLRSSDNVNRAFTFGQSTDKMAPADYTGDGKTDIGFWRQSTGEWFILRSEDSTFFSFPFGTAGDIPAPGDFDGDGKADQTVFRPSEGNWYIVRSSDSQVQITAFGTAEDKPVVEDYDGDGKDDIAIFRPSVSQWWLLRSTAGIVVYQFGTTGDRPAPADFTGDNKADVAFWRPSSGEWFILRSEDTSFFSFPFGTNGDIPAPGDYDGDGKADPTVFRTSDNTWYKLQSTSGFEAVTFGATGDIPTPASYIP